MERICTQHHVSMRPKRSSPTINQPFDHVTQPTSIHHSQPQHKQLNCIHSIEMSPMSSHAHLPKTTRERELNNIEIWVLYHHHSQTKPDSVYRPRDISDIISLSASRVQMCLTFTDTDIYRELIRVLNHTCIRSLADSSRCPAAFESYSLRSANLRDVSLITAVIRVRSRWMCRTNTKKGPLQLRCDRNLTITRCDFVLFATAQIRTART